MFLPRQRYNRALVHSVVVAVLLSSASLRTREAWAENPSAMQDRAYEEVVLALGSPDIKEAHEAVLEVVRRGEPMIPHLLKLKGRGQAFRGYGLGHANASQLISLPSGDDKRDKGHVVTLEVAALYLICAIYHANLSFAQSPYLTDLSLQPIKRRTFNSTRLISKAWRSTTAWGAQLRKVGLESLRATKQDPLSGSGVAFW